MKNIRLKALIMLIVVSLIFGTSGMGAFGENILPKLDQAFGISVPFPEKVINRSGTSYTKENRRIDKFISMSFAEYNLIGKSLQKSGYSLKEKNFSADRIELKLEKEGKEISITYDLTNYLFYFVYPKYYFEDTGSYDLAEWNKSAFPEIEEMVGTVLPRLSSGLGRGPDSSGVKDDFLIEKYKNFTEEDYNTISKYLVGSGCSVSNYYKEDKILTINLEKNGLTFVLLYDPDKELAEVHYPTKAYLEPGVSSTPRPTATPAPTVNPDEYYTYAALFVGIVKGTQKNPASLQVHSVRIMTYNKQYYVVIDFSGMNGFGGYTRSTYSFKFEPGYISLTGDSSDYDTYENHKSEFRLIESLDVDRVMSLINK